MAFVFNKTDNHRQFLYCSGMGVFIRNSRPNICADKWAGSLLTKNWVNAQLQIRRKIRETELLEGSKITRRSFYREIYCKKLGKRGNFVSEEESNIEGIGNCT